MRFVPRLATAVGIPILLWVAALLVYAWVVHAANTPRVLTGEESSVSFLNVLGISERFQFSFFSTNFDGHVFYWIASHLDPRFDLFYGRRWKAAAMALIAPLVYVLLTRRGNIGRAGAALGAVTAVLLPGIASFAWLATENGLEAIGGLVALLTVTSKRRVWPLGLVFAGIAVGTFGAGLAWAAGVGAFALWRVARSAHRPRDAALALTGAVAGLGVVYFPKLWWTNSGYIVTGGGTRDFDHVASNLSGLATELVSGTKGSYYFFDGRPALAGTTIAVAGLLGLILALIQPRSRGLWPLWVIGFACLGIYAIAGGVLGVRRAIAIPVIWACGIGVLADAVVTQLAACVRLLRPPPARAAVNLVLALALILPLGLSLRHWRADLEDGRRTLPLEFAFPRASGETMPMVLGRLRDGLHDGSLTTAQLVSTYEGERTLAIILLLADRDGQSTAGFPSPRAITQLLYESPRCYEDCRPVPGRP